MKTAFITSLAGAATLCVGAVAFAQGPPASPETVAIVDEGAAGYSVRHFPSRLHLYTYALDTPGRSACINTCISVWPPVRGNATSRPVGDWTLVPRPDGDPQWAYKGAPVYVRYHDDPDSPIGEGRDDRNWRLVPNIPKTAPSAP